MRFLTDLEIYQQGKLFSMIMVMGLITTAKGIIMTIVSTNAPFKA
jgi:hypothetical protein